MGKAKKKMVSKNDKQKKRDSLKDVIRFSMQPPAKAINQPEKTSNKRDNNKGRT